MSSADDERERLLGAVAETIAGRGYTCFSVDAVVAAAGVSQEIFFEHFEDESDVVLAAHRATFEPFYESICQACTRAPSWPQGLVAAIGTAVDFAAEHPERAQLLTAGGLPPYARVANGVQESTDRLAALLSQGRALSGEAELPAVTERFVISSISGLIASHLITGRSRRLPLLKSELTSFALIPYLGTARAVREAEDGE